MAVDELPADDACGIDRCSQLEQQLEGALEVCGEADGLSLELRDRFWVAADVAAGGVGASDQQQGGDGHGVRWS